MIPKSETTTTILLDRFEKERKKKDSYTLFYPLITRDKYFGEIIRSKE